MTQQPQAKYRHDYQAPDYTITDLALDFDLDAEVTTVTAVSQVKRQVPRRHLLFSTVKISP